MLTNRIRGIFFFDQSLLILYQAGSKKLIQYIVEMDGRKMRMSVTFLSFDLIAFDDSNITVIFHSHDLCAISIYYYIVQCNNVFPIRINTLAARIQTSGLDKKHLL